MRTSTMRCLETFAVAAPTRGSAAPSTWPQKWQLGTNEPTATHLRGNSARPCRGGLLAACLLDEGGPQSELCRKRYEQRRGWTVSISRHRVASSESPLR